MSAALATVAAAAYPWTPADLRRVLLLAADGHDVGLVVEHRDRAAPWFNAGFVPVLDRVHLSPDLAGLLREVGMLAEREIDGGPTGRGHAFVTQDRARELAKALPVEAAGP